MIRGYRKEYNQILSCLNCENGFILCCSEKNRDRYNEKAKIISRQKKIEYKQVAYTNADLDKLKYGGSIYE